MKILLTGGSGFIGKNLLEILSKDKELKIIAPLRQDLNLEDSKVVIEFLKKENFDVVLHSAGFGGSRSKANLEDVYKINKQIFLNIVQNQQFFKRMIVFGSGAEYGKHEPIISVKEEDFGKNKPLDEYGKAKYFISEYIKEHQNILNLRCFGVFGKYEDYSTRFISNIICMSLSGKPIVVRQNAVFDYIYVNDLARIVLHFLKNEPKEKFYNAGTGIKIQLLDLAKMVKEITNNPYEIEVLNPGFGNEYTCNNQKLLNELGDFHFTSVRQAVEELVSWYKSNWHSIDKTFLTAYL